MVEESVSTSNAAQPLGKIAGISFRVLREASRWLVAEFGGIGQLFVAAGTQNSEQHDLCWETSEPIIRDVACHATTNQVEAWISMDRGQQEVHFWQLSGLERSQFGCCLLSIDHVG
jgi:hypothetical protein